LLEPLEQWFYARLTSFSRLPQSFENNPAPRMAVRAAAAQRIGELREIDLRREINEYALPDRCRLGIGAPRPTQPR